MPHVTSSVLPFAGAPYAAIEMPASRASSSAAHEVALAPRDALGKRGVGRERGPSPPSRSAAARGRGPDRQARRRPACTTCSRSEPPCVSQLLDVAHAQAVTREDRLEREQRKIREMLVVDLIELHVDDRAQHVRELDRRESVRFQDDRDPADEVVQVRDVREHVVRGEQIGAQPLRDHPPRLSAGRRTRSASGRPRSIAALATFSAGSTPTTGTSRATNSRSRYPSLLASSTTSDDA